MIVNNQELQRLKHAGRFGKIVHSQLMGLMAGSCYTLRTNGEVTVAGSRSKAAIRAYDHTIDHKTCKRPMGSIHVDIDNKAYRCYYGVCILGLQNHLKSVMDDLNANYSGPVVYNIVKHLFKPYAAPKIVLTSPNQLTIHPHDAKYNDKISDKTISIGLNERGCIYLYFHISNKTKHFSLSDPDLLVAMATHINERWAPSVTKS